MSVTEGQVRRAGRYAAVPWDGAVGDHRKARGLVHAHRAVLGLLCLGFAAGRRTLRRVEDFSKDLSRGARRALGLVRKKVSDTTLYRVLAGQSTAGLRETVQAWVREKWRSKVIQNDLLAIGVVSIDGKGTWSSTAKTVAGAKESSCDENGKPLRMFGALRATLTSSRAAPCVDQEWIGAKEAESPAFRVMFPRLCTALGFLFRIVTGDAGLCARENAQVVEDQGKWYLFGLKLNQPTLLLRAWRHFAKHLASTEVRARTEERADGGRIERKLYVWTVDGEKGLDMPGLREFWLVWQTTYPKEGGFRSELRFFASSIPPEALTDDRKLAVVRMHWGAENGHNWTMDVMLEEDDRQPCQASRESLETVAWLRIIGYNIASAFRAHAPRQDRLPMPWKRAMELLRDAFVHDRPLEVASATI